MQDRIPTYAGRVKLTPVTGQADTYDLTRADEPIQVGTPLNKATLLTDETAAALGLTDATVNGAFEKLTSAVRYGTYLWQKRSYETFTEANFSELEQVNYSSPTSTYYADAYTVNPTTGKITLTNSTYMNVGVGTTNTLKTLRGKYFMQNGDKQDYIYYASEDAEYNDTTGYIYATKGTAMPVIGEWFFIVGDTADTYPTSGVVDGYEYKYIGSINELIASGRIATGTYTGTGTYGSSNKNSLTFEFEPKVVIISRSDGWSNSANGESRAMICLNGMTTAIKFIPQYPTTLVWNGNTLQFYATTAYQSYAAYLSAEQLNSSGYKYYYVAIG